ncbi:helix-turn-helix domain-containing protein [Salegentibacter mishustinae]|uniref:Helix-turn-helix domain-containing protein n=1 Tax=Salegentibacter mishustinae TaxID=270918 RepID=A0A0Q9ZC63_9FLAO|nr:helix-turn-helix domain-containing protein [Salegentibacter mishustinae]KRG30571.1 hypothetical protein APR42_01510 [Salegentibacter mishustinae]PNW23460.1 hypothetical protein APB85_01505 [Salegentibacter mishustinae]PZX66530.1 excisionase family DNA binding protein [Salegentibacter mishustinae]GGW83073.1 hypothetical protein GCM10008086_08910 [Salegentibacter mishustinae]
MTTVTQMHNASPEELISEMQKVFKKEVEALKEHFTPKEPEELLTRTETAELLKLSIASVHNWVKNGWLKQYQKGGRVYFKRSEIMESLTACD